MPELITDETRKARKSHKCNLCYREIQPGEQYHYQFLKYDGETYDWRECLECKELAGYLWSYIDPDEGMTEESFSEGLQEFCAEFVCVNCPEYDKENGECRIEYPYCRDKTIAFLRENGSPKRLVGKYGRTYLGYPEPQAIESTEMA